MYFPPFTTSLGRTLKLSSNFEYFRRNVFDSSFHYGPASRGIKSILNAKLFEGANLNISYYDISSSVSAEIYYTNAIMNLCNHYEMTELRKLYSMMNIASIDVARVHDCKCVFMFTI